MINDIGNDQIHYFNVKAKKNIFTKNRCVNTERSILSNFHGQHFLIVQPSNMQFRSQKIKFLFDGKLTWVPSIVIRGHKSATDAKGAQKSNYRARVWN